MKEIHLIDKKYQVIDSKANKIESLIFGNKVQDVTIFDEKVRIQYLTSNPNDKAEITVNGIIISKFTEIGDFETTWSIHEIVSFLNQIRISNCNEFLNKFKENIEFQYIELKSLYDKNLTILSHNKTEEKCKIENELITIQNRLISLLSKIQRVKLIL